MVVDRTPMNLLPIFSRFLKNLHNKVNANVLYIYTAKWRTSEFDQLSDFEYQE